MMDIVSTAATHMSDEKLDTLVKTSLRVSLSFCEFRKVISYSFKLFISVLFCFFLLHQELLLIYEDMFLYCTNFSPLQDYMMISYLASLAKTQLSLQERLVAL